MSLLTGALLKDSVVMLITILAILTIAIIPSQTYYNDLYDKKVYFSELEKTIVSQKNSIIYIAFKYDIEKALEGNEGSANTLGLKIKNKNQFIVFSKESITFYKGSSASHTHNFILPNIYESIEFDISTNELKITT